MNDIFISYRRKDGETAAFLIYRDLSNDGYSVFYDHKSLGGGDFQKSIHKCIQESDDVIVILSESSFSDKINDDNDIYRYEIETALSLKKRIVGIMLEGFSGFPTRLPESITAVRKANCLKLYMAYYDAMYSRLTSGAFLTSLPKGKEASAPSDLAINSTIPVELQPLASLSMSERNVSIQILLKIMDSFNNSEICMRFYHYIDLFDRSYGVKEVPTYDGVIPTDLVTYLSFFETLYIIVGSGTLNLSIIDFAYRFRFFAGCNNPTMQESELLPLGYQYPNILSFYNLWSEYIVEHYNHSRKIGTISEQIPLYEYDLHKRYASYCFAANPSTPMKIRFLNRYLCWQNLNLKMIDICELKVCMDFQSEVLNAIKDNDENNFFEALTEEEMHRALSQGSGIGLYMENRLVAQMNLLLKPDDRENLALDLAEEYSRQDLAIFDYIVVDPDVRGYGIQKTLLFVAECIARNANKDGIIAVTSPLNIHSIKNFISQGYKIVNTIPKYKSIRHYVVKSLLGSGEKGHSESG